MQIGYEYITQASDLDQVVRAVVEANVIGLDIETVGSVHNPEGYIRLVQISTGKKVFVIDLLHVGKEPARRVFQAICDPSIIKIGQNLKFEQQWIWRDYREEIWPLFDTWRASVLIDNGKKLPHDLYSVYERYLGIAPPTEDLGGSNWSEPVLTPEQKAYAASDVIYLHQLRERMKPILTKKGLNQIALIEFGAIFPEACVEIKGFPIDVEMWSALEEDTRVKAAALKAELLKELPNPKQQLTFFGMEPDFNIDSPAQILQSLNKLTGYELDATNEMTLAMHAADFPLINKLLDYRGLKQNLKTYGASYLAHLCKHCGRFHSQYFPFTEAGRYSCSKSNIQNVPRDPRYRDCFRPKKGRIFLISDWSNVETRVIAEISGDPRLIEIFNDPDGDVHRSTAAFILNKAEADVLKQERQKTKSVVFGYSFGMQAPKFVLYARANYGVVVSLKEARENRDKFFELYKGIGTWHESRFSSKNRVTRTIAGRLRYLPEDAHSELVNSEVQGTAADALKKALRRIHKDLLKHFSWDDTWLTHHVHDETIIETSDESEEKLTFIKQLQKKGMEEELQSFLTKVPAVAEGGAAYSWAEK